MAPLLQFHKKLQGKHTFLKEKKYFVLGELFVVLRGCGVAKWLAGLPAAWAYRQFETRQKGKT